LFKNVAASGNQISRTDVSAKSDQVSTGATSSVTGQPAEEVPFELKLNITDSEIVVVEDTSQWDTNAVILKVTNFSRKSDFRTGFLIYLLNLLIL
jgi:hypothetical protein